MVSPVIFWFRRDLRLGDHPALMRALELADGDVAAVFIVDEHLAARGGPARSAYLTATLRALDDTLGGRLIIRRGDPAEVLMTLARETRAREAVATGDFSPAGRARDDRVQHRVRAQGLSLSFTDSPYVVSPGTLRTKSATPYQVFTPFRRAWELAPATGPLSAPAGAAWIAVPSLGVEELARVSLTHRPEYFGDLSDDVPAFDSRVGEAGAHSTLDDFLARVDAYAEARNMPGHEGTSRLSPHLRFGTLHPRQVLAALPGASRGADVFRSEICWREFYADVLWHHPASAWSNLRPSLSHLRVDRDARAVERFANWARGQTGYPLVDAGMRQLLAEGWMHNRARMVCASFLVKHLHLDWRWGAKWFMWRLVDADVASNQHGWQWTAGTGTDAAPFDRVFNPTLQAQRFDADGDYIHRYVSELAAVPAPQCLQPGGGEGLLAPSGYVAPMIDAARERQEALARFHEARDLARAVGG